MQKERSCISHAVRIARVNCGGSFTATTLGQSNLAGFPGKPHLESLVEFAKDENGLMCKRRLGVGRRGAPAEKPVNGGQ